MTRTRTKGESVPSRFEPGARVRVKQGVRDPDFADIPLGGWAGTVKQVERAKGENTYLIAWDRATLKGMHPIYPKRCERDGLELESMWLGEEDLELDDGTTVPIEPPTTIVTQPLTEKDQDDRVRMAPGLAHVDGRNKHPKANRKGQLRRIATGLSVEAAGIAPASRDTSMKASTCVSDHLVVGLDTPISEVIFSLSHHEFSQHRNGWLSVGDPALSSSGGASGRRPATKPFLLLGSHTERTSVLGR